GRAVASRPHTRIFIPMTLPRSILPIAVGSCLFVSVAAGCGAEPPAERVSASTEQALGPTGWTRIPIAIAGTPDLCPSLPGGPASPGQVDMVARAHDNSVWHIFSWGTLGTWTVEPLGGQTL